MSLSLVPTQVNPIYNMTVSFDGTPYGLSFVYSEREACYHMHISDSSGNLLVAGIKLLAQWPLLHKYAVAGLPSGEIIIMSNTADPGPPDVGELGDGLAFTMYYASQDQFSGFTVVWCVTPRQNRA